MTEQLFKEVTKWQRETFGHATPLSKIAHLKEEIEELQKDVAGGETSAVMEYADCFLLLFGSAASYGMSYQDICKAIEAKMHINKKRKWGKPGPDGVVNHIKEL